MALYFDEVSTIAQTHILVIGVGGYPYLKGGTKEKVQTIDAAKGLGQLTSPAVSAEAFCNMAMEFKENESWVTPLGSIEVLVSNAPDAPDVFFNKPILPPTIENIKDAYFSWRERCDSNTDNVAIFLFCGHGLGKGEHYLLAEDFGKRPENPWDGCFAFDMTSMGFGTCRAKTQIFFVDSCRQVTFDMEGLNLSIAPLEQAKFDTSECQYRLVQKAAAQNESAYGLKNRESFYVSALIKALKGYAAVKETGQWTVSTGRLASKMSTYLAMEDESANYRQRCISTSSEEVDIIVLSGPPSVTFKITCNPADALTYADLSFVELNTRALRTRAAENNPWTLDVEAGFYEINAIFQNGNFSTTPETTFVMPPLTNHAVKCTV